MGTFVDELTNVSPEMKAKAELHYVILVHASPDKVSEAASVLMKSGWQPHGDLKLQIAADPSQPTGASLMYIQAMTANMEDVLYES